MKITYEPIEDSNESLTKADLHDFYIKIKALYDNDGRPAKIIQINQKNLNR